MGVDAWPFGSIIDSANELKGIYKQMGNNADDSRRKMVDAVRHGWSEPLPGKEVESIENRASFFARLEGLVSEEELDKIDFAYDLAKEAHRPQLRDGGERYFEHCRATALTLIDELGITDPDLVCTMLLHDVGEDSPMFGAGIASYEELQQKMRYRVTKIFNSRVAENLIVLTKPNKLVTEFASKEEIKQFYFERLSKSPTEAVMCKACDRLHNLRTVESKSPEKILEQIRETEEYLMPIFEGRVEDETYSQQMNYLVENINLEIQKLKDKYQG